MQEWLASWCKTGLPCLVFREGSILVTKISRTPWNTSKRWLVGVEGIAGGVDIERVYLAYERADH